MATVESPVPIADPLEDVFAGDGLPSEAQMNVAVPPDDEQFPSENSGLVDEPPDGGYGWVCVACTFFINAHTWGLNTSYGVFLAHYLAQNVYPGATYLEYAFVGGLSVATALLISPIATYTTRQYGTRTTLLTGVFFETISLIGASFSNRIWQLFLSQGVCFGWGMGFLFVGSVAVIPQWFTKKRSLANGIGAAGSGIGGMVYSLATNAMIEALGLSWAFRILGILAFSVNSVCALLLKDRNTFIGPTQLAFDYKLFMNGPFLLVLGWGFFSMLGYIVLLFSLPNYALSIGLTAKQGSIIGALLNLGQGIGRPAAGIFSDVVGRINVAGLLTFFVGLLCLVVWIFAKSFGVLVFFAILVGTGAGTFWATVAPVGAEVVGLKELPSALSITWIALVLPVTFSEPIGLVLRQSTGNIYIHAQIFTGAMYLVGSLCMLFLRGWKIGELERSIREQEKAPDSAEAANDQSSTSLLGRMCAWKKV